ncbi:MAG: 30S ribosomal protein S27ae [Candidatus Altiarchaeales archaeon]|nr:30S ribosomal protein S27ae [Candidatus Altiarchaeales archaeon]
MADKKKQGKWELYESGDKLTRKRKNCPKCGDGVFLAEHKDRLSCGFCGYTESKQTPKEPEKQEGEPESAGDAEDKQKKK